MTITENPANVKQKGILKYNYAGKLQNLMKWKEGYFNIGEIR